MNIFKLTIIAYLLFFAVSCSNTKVIVKSTPSGAEVSEASLGNLGKTPLEIELNCGKLQFDKKCYAHFHFSKPGFNGESLPSRKIEGSEIIVHAILEKIKTSLQIIPYPGFATVTVTYENESGEEKELALFGESNKQSIDDIEVWEGEDALLLNIRIQAPGYISENNPVTLKKGDQLTLEYTLVERKANISFTSLPDGVDVYERNLGYLGRTPFHTLIPYDQLIRKSSLRSSQLQDPVYFYLKFIKEGFEAKEVIKKIDLGLKPIDGIEQLHTIKETLKVLNKR